MYWQFVLFDWIRVESGRLWPTTAECRRIRHADVEVKPKLLQEQSSEAVAGGDQVGKQVSGISPPTSC